MANYPQLDDCSGVWTLKQVNNAIMGGYWRNANDRAIVGGGFTPSYTNTIGHFKMSSSGDATDFGDLTDSRGEFGAMSNFTRCIFAGGNSATSPNSSNIIDYVIFNTEGNAADFGDLGASTYRSTGVGGNATRGIVTEGNSDGDQLQFITPSSTGNAVDFGNRTLSGTFVAGVTSPTRVCFGGAFTPSTSNVIDFVEIATTGNAVDFGDLSNSLRDAGGCSSSTRGVFIGGLTPSKLTTLDSITIASQGNAVDYGDLITAKRGPAGVSNSVTGFATGGDTGSTVDVIESFKINTGGTATDFGDLTTASKNASANSASHGGLNNGYEGTRIAPIPTGGGVGQRGLFAGGSPTRSTIRKVHISTDGNTNNFGDLSVGRRQFVGGGSGLTRGLFGGGYSPGAHSDVIDYITFSHEGNAADFGNLSATGEDGAGLANETRAVFAEGVNAGTTIVDTISFVTIATIGNITDFGNLSASRHSMGAVASTTRGVFGGGRAGASPNPLVNIMEYITIASAGDVTDFGDLSQTRAQVAPTSSSVRGVFAGGTTPNTSTAVNTIDFITIASTGDASDFGDLTQARFGIMDSVVSNSITGIFGAGRAPGNVNTIDKITIASAGDASDFGDLNETTNNVCGASNGHGGLN